MMKYLILALLSANVSADDDIFIATGVCAVMATQMKPDVVTSNIVKYWEATAKNAGVTFSEYHKGCEDILALYESTLEVKAKPGKGKL